MNGMYSPRLNLLGGIPEPPKNMKVNWDYEIPNRSKNKNVPNHQPEMGLPLIETPLKS